MSRLAKAQSRQLTLLADAAWECPHCHRSQVVKTYGADLGAANVDIRQCLHCTKLEVTLSQAYEGRPHAQRLPIVVYPKRAARPAKTYQHLPFEIQDAYEQACALVSVHAGAAGAYARRALEILLDGMGYKAPTLLRSIELARAEPNVDKRLPRRLLDRLDYVKEVGNFALHVRRNGEMSIIEVTKAEVEACLSFIEDILTFVFEEPGDEQAQREMLNAQLAQANKKPLPPSDAEPLWSAEKAAAEPPEGDAALFTVEGDSSATTHA